MSVRAKGGDRRAGETVSTPCARAPTLNDVPVDVLAQRLLTAGGALYKNLHDGRLELREHVAVAALR